MTLLPAKRMAFQASRMACGTRVRGDRLRLPHRSLRLGGANVVTEHSPELSINSGPFEVSAASGEPPEEREAHEAAGATLSSPPRAP